MTEVESIIRQGLEQIGLGPVRVRGALEGTPIFGDAGLLNSLELVQFITTISESLQIDPYELLQGGEGDLRASFHDIHSLSAFLAVRLNSRAGV